MARVPTKVMINLMKASEREKNRWIKMGRGYSAYRDKNSVVLRHYGTVILYVDTVREKYQIGTGAYSGSDRDAINSVLHIEGIYDTVHMRKGEMISRIGEDRDQNLIAGAEHIFG